MNKKSSFFIVFAIAILSIGTLGFLRNNHTVDYLKLHQRSGDNFEQTGPQIPYGASVDLIDEFSAGNLVWKKVGVTYIEGWTPGRTVDCDEDNCTVVGN